MEAKASGICERHIDTWIQVFFPKLESLIADGKKPVIVAISRKMPRFLDWIMKHYMDEISRQKYQPILDKCEIVTELAIPFLLKEWGWNVSDGANSLPLNNISVILLDDCSITGNTIWEAYYNVNSYIKIQPFVSVIFLCEESLVRKAFKESIIGLDNIITLALKKMEACISFVCDKNETTSLPIDLEFPILHDTEMQTTIAKTINSDIDLALRSLQYASEEVQLNSDISRPTDNYLYIITPKNKNANNSSISIVLNDEYQNGYNNEFAKVRIFVGESLSDTKFVAYCPNVLDSTEIYDRNLFVRTEYALIWNDILSNIPRELYNSPFIDSSLVIAANYLYSLSCIIRNKQRLRINSFNDLTINNKDLNLIFGKTLSDIIIDKIAHIVRKEITSPSKRGRFTLLPYRIVTKEYENYYITNTTRILSESSKIEDIDELLQKIFHIAHYAKTNNYLENNKDVNWYGIYETFTSLKNLIESFHKSKDLDCKIHCWIDKNIDGGTIVPRYRYLKADNKRYWMRFFSYSSVVELL